MVLEMSLQLSSQLYGLQISFYSRTSCRLPGVFAPKFRFDLRLSTLFLPS